MPGSSSSSSSAAASSESLKVQKIVSVLENGLRMPDPLTVVDAFFNDGCLPPPADVPHGRNYSWAELMRRVWDHAGTVGTAGETFRISASSGSFGEIFGRAGSGVQIETPDRAGTGHPHPRYPRTPPTLLNPHGRIPRRLRQQLHSKLWSRDPAGTAGITPGPNSLPGPYENRGRNNRIWSGSFCAIPRL